MSSAPRATTTTHLWMTPIPSSADDRQARPPLGRPVTPSLITLLQQCPSQTHHSLLALASVSGATSCPLFDIYCRSLSGYVHPIPCHLTHARKQPHRVHKRTTVDDTRSQKGLIKHVEAECHHSPQAPIHTTNILRHMPGCSTSW